MNISPNHYYRNIKTNDLYEVLYIGLDVTDNKDQDMVVYQNPLLVTVYIRSIKEFEEKFIEDKNITEDY